MYFSAIFFKVKLIHNTSTIQRRITTAQPAAMSGNINESFQFDVPHDRLMDIYFVINFHKRQITTAGPAESLVGQVVIGSEVEFCEAQSHWNIMLSQPRQPNSFTHPIR